MEELSWKPAVGPCFTDHRFLVMQTNIAHAQPRVSTSDEIVQAS